MSDKTPTFDDIAESGSSEASPALGLNVKDLLPDAVCKLQTLIHSESDMVALRACVEVLNRVYGKPVTITEINGRLDVNHSLAGILQGMRTAAGVPPANEIPPISDLDDNPTGATVIEAKPLAFELGERPSKFKNITPVQ